MEGACRVGGFIPNLQLYQRRAHGRGLALGSGQAQHLARDRRGDLHGRLVGHHVDQGGVLGHVVTDGHVPSHDLGLGDALAHVGQLEDVVRHPQPSITWRMAAATRAGPGKYSHSKAWG